MVNLRTITAILALMAASPVLADDWTADRLRGTVVIMQGSEWVTLSRGQLVPDGGKIRTESDGRAELVRGAERITLAANTEIAIRDASGQQMTNVIQSKGSVTIEAERRNVQHFSVQTPVLAAIVKGTQFTVTYRNGEASVSVDRGVVEVQDAKHETVVEVTRGQTAVASQSRPVDVSGPGSEETVFLIQGELVPAVARDAVLSGDISPDEAAAVAAGQESGRPPAPGNGGNNGGVGHVGPATGNPGNSNAGGPGGPHAGTNNGPNGNQGHGNPGGHGPGGANNGPGRGHSNNGNPGGHNHDSGPGPSNNGPAAGHGNAGPGHGNSGPGGGNDKPQKKPGRGRK